MNAAILPRNVPCIGSVTLMLASICFPATAGFKPDFDHYRTPQEALEYVVWKALKEGRPPCVTVYPIGISLFCIMGQCIHDSTEKPHCQCDRNFSGLTCSVYKGRCTSEHLCAPHLCKDNPTKISQFECVCKPGYHVPDDPAFSYCVPNNLVPKNTTFEANFALMQANTTTPPSWMENGASSALAWEKSNTSGMDVVCTSSDFLMCFIESKKVNMTVDTVLKRALQSANEQRKTTQEFLHNFSQEPEESYSSDISFPHNNLKYSKMVPSNRGNTDIIYKKNSVALKHQAMSSPMVKLRSSQPRSSLLPYRKVRNSRGYAHNTATMQRRSLSTFLVQETKIFDKLQLSLSNNTGSHEDKKEYKTRSTSEGQVTTLQKSADLDDFHAGNDRAQTQPVATVSINNMRSEEANSLPSIEEEDYEVVQFHRRALQKLPIVAKEGQEAYSTLNRPLPAAYFMGAEGKKAIEKSHLKDKHSPIETQDQIIENLKHMVEVSENTKSNITNSSDVSYISAKLKTVVEANNKNELSDSSGLQKTYLREDLTAPQDEAQPENETEPKDAHRTSQFNISLDNYFYKLSESDKGPSPTEGSITRPQDNTIENRTYLSSRDDIPEIQGGTRALKNEDMLLHQAAVDSSFKSPSSSTVDVNFVGADKVTQTLTTIANASNSKSSKREIKVVQRTFFEESLPKTILSKATRESDLRLGHVMPKLLGPTRNKLKEPMLFFNVTIFNQQGRNMSSALYLVPNFGTKAILISWGIYNPNIT